MNRLHVAGIALLFAGAAYAHHGWDGYDSKKTLTLEGTIETATYENPHSAATFKTSDKTWNVVLAPPSRMMNRGLTKDMLTPNTKATVVGYPHLKEGNELRAERITIDGKTIELR